MNSVNTALPDKAAVEYSFSKAAILYDRYADHHRIIAERLMDFIRPDAAGGSILEVGCGTGILTEKLLDRFPASDVTALDISPDMIDRCRSKLNLSKRLSFLVTDAEEYCRRRNRYDLVASSCSLQWIHDRERFVESICALLPVGGKCLMAIPLRGMLHELVESCICGARKVMRQLDLDTGEEWETRFENSEMDILSSSTESVSCLYDHPLEVLKAIRGIGAGIDQSPAFLKPADMKKMTDYYRRHFEVDSFGKVSSTYRILYILGRKV
ncbi:MAG: methyltransferase domain-containing protein [Candidatus Aegiribacteria sp.]|nr:methyltransferase domain-containing protein [Candidatus Aegiribacteria sp.]